MNLVRLNIFNVIIIIIFWVTTAFFSQFAAKLVVFFSFLLLLYKNQVKYLIISYFMILLLSDSRFEVLKFASEIKPFIAILFYIICLLIFQKRSLNNSVKFIYPIIFFIVLSFLLSSLDLIIFQKSVSYILMLLLIIPFFNVIKDQESNYFFKVLIYCFLIILVLGNILFFFNDEIVLLNGRFRGLFGNPNGLGIFIVLFFFIFNILKNNYPKLFNEKENLLITGILLLNLIFSQSRSCILSIIIFYVFNFFLNYSFIIALISTILILLFYAIISTNLFDLIRILNIQNYIRVDTLQNASGRYIAWGFLYDKINLNFLFFGNGVGSTELLFKKNYATLSQLGHEGNAHNSYLTICFDTGFLGLLSFLYFLIMNFLNSNNYIKNLPILVGLLLSALFESWMSASLNPFTILLMLIIALISKSSNNFNFEKQKK